MKNKRLHMILKEESNEKLENLVTNLGAATTTELIIGMIDYFTEHNDLIKNGYKCTYEREIHGKKEKLIIQSYLFKYKS